MQSKFALPNVNQDFNPSLLTPSAKPFEAQVSLMSHGSSQGRAACRVSPSMSRRCMMMASSTSLGMYPNERMAIPSSCLEMKPFPSRSRTRKASRISTRGKAKKVQWSYGLVYCIEIVGDCLLKTPNYFTNSDVSKTFNGINEWPNEGQKKKKE